MGFRNPINGIPPSSITGDMIAADSIDGDHITDAAITGTHITDDSITTPKLAANAVTASKIDADAVTAAKIAADAIQTSHLAADAIDVKHTITGAMFRTAASGQRYEISSNDTNKIVGYSGHGLETAPGFVSIDNSNVTDIDSASVALFSPNMNNAGVARLVAQSYQTAKGKFTKISLDADEVKVGGGRPIRLLDFGKTTVSTDGNGEGTIDHSLGVVPEAFICVCQHSSAQRDITVRWRTGSQVGVVIYTGANGNLVAGGNIEVNWFAIA